jgi:hypothetical protein
MILFINFTTFFFETLGIPSALLRLLILRRVCKGTTTPKKIRNVHTDLAVVRALDSRGIVL